MKFLIVGDLHLHTWKGFKGKNNEERISSRLLVQRNALNQIVDIATKNNANIVMTGDVYHKVGEVPTEARNIFHEFLHKLKQNNINYYLVTGNHDLSIRKNCSWLHNALSPYMLDYQDSLGALDIDGIKVRFVNYNDEDIDIKNYDIVVLHKQPNVTSKYGFEHDGIDWKKLANHNRFVFFGHYHNTKVLSDNCISVGTPIQMDFGQVDEDHGIWLLNTEDWKVDFVKLKYPEFRIVQTYEEVVDDYNYYLVKSPTNEIVNDNVICQKELPKFEERIKATSFKDILLEWLKRQNKPKKYLKFIEDEIGEKYNTLNNFFKGRLINLGIKNFASFEDLSVNFENGWYLVTGENGSGKTSFFEAIYYGLFSETTKGLGKKDVIRDRPKLQKDAEISLILKDKDKSYKIYRSVKKGLEITTSDGEILTEGMTKSQAQEYLEKNILGFNKYLYQASCYFSQKNLTLLTHLGDAEKTNLITNLLGFEKYDDLYERMKELIDETNEKKEVDEKKKSDIENDIWKLEEQKKSIQDQINQNIQFNDKIVQNIELKSKKLDELNKVTFSEEKLPSFESFDSKIVENQNTIKQSEEEINKQNKLIDEITKEQNEIEKKITELKTSNKFNSTEMNKLTIKINNVKSAECGERCEKCGSVVQESEKAKFCEEKLKDIEKLVQITTQNEKKLKEYNTTLNKTYDVEVSYRNKIKETKSNINLINQNIQSLQKEKTNILIKQKEFETKKAKVESEKEMIQREIKSLEKQKDEYCTLLKNKKKQIEELEKKILNAKTLLDNQIKMLSKYGEYIEIYEFWKNAFSNKGIRPLLLDAFCNEFNEIVADYCLKVSNGQFNLELTPTATIKSGEERNKIGMNVIIDGKTTMYEKLSGGEETRINLPVCLALNKWICQKYQIKDGILGFIVLDEVFSNLDRLGEEQVASVLDFEGQNKFVGVISHGADIQSYTSKVWTMKKENDISYLEVN